MSLDMLVNVPGVYVYQKKEREGNFMIYILLAVLNVVTLVRTRRSPSDASGRSRLHRPVFIRHLRSTGTRMFA